MTWQSRAACRDDADPELWFAYDPLEVAAAKSICASCPVRLDCLDAAMADEEDVPVLRRHGVWGGLTGPERARLADPNAIIVAPLVDDEDEAPDKKSPDVAKVYRRLHGDPMELNDAERMDVVRILWSEGMSDRDIEQRSGIAKRQVFRDRVRQGLPSQTNRARSA